MTYSEPPFSQLSDELWHVFGGRRRFPTTRAVVGSTPMIKVPHAAPISIILAPLECRRPSEALWHTPLPISKYATALIYFSFEEKTKILHLSIALQGKNQHTAKPDSVELSQSRITWIVTSVRVESARKIWDEHNPGTHGQATLADPAAGFRRAKMGRGPNLGYLPQKLKTPRINPLFLGWTKFTFEKK